MLNILRVFKKVNDNTCILNATKVQDDYSADFLKAHENQTHFLYLRNNRYEVSGGARWGQSCPLLGKFSSFVGEPQWLQ